LIVKHVSTPSLKQENRYKIKFVLTPNSSLLLKNGRQSLGEKVCRPMQHGHVVGGEMKPPLRMEVYKKGEKAMNIQA
jgi:hypothetical protein